MKFKGALLLALGLSMSFSPRLALASEGDVAAAEVLFQKGREAMDAGDYDTACASFAESQRLDGAAGTVMNLASCQEKQGKLASAWENWQHALRLLPEGDRRRIFVEKRVNELEADLPRLTILVAEGMPETATIERDGTLLGKITWGQALPVDAGSHEIIVRSPDHKPRSFKITLDAGETKDLLVDVGPVLPRSESGDKPPGQTQRTIGIAVGGVGLLGVATAAVTGLLLPGAKSTIDENCPDKSCNEEGFSALRRGKTLLAFNTVGWIVGGVGLATGTTLFFTSKKKPEQARAAQGTSAESMSLEVYSDGAFISYLGTF
jgi:hypothetical protein